MIRHAFNESGAAYMLIWIAEKNACGRLKMNFIIYRIPYKSIVISEISYIILLDNSNSFN